MQRNLFEIYQTKVETLLEQTQDSFHFDDVKNLEMYLKTAELMLINAKDNHLKLQNFIIAITFKKIIEQHKKYEEFTAISHKMIAKPIEEKLEEPTKPTEMKHQNMTLEFAKQINELHKQNKDLKDKIYKANEEIKELKNKLLEKEQEIDNEKIRIENLNQLIDHHQQRIHDLSIVKRSEEKEATTVDKREVENLIKKYQATNVFGGTWKLNRTISKLDELLNQDKTNPFITKNAIRNCIVSPDKLQFFQNPPKDRDKTSTTDKFICELADVFNKKP